jgi:hypothetical protein
MSVKRLVENFVVDSLLKFAFQAIRPNVSHSRPRQHNVYSTIICAAQIAVYISVKHTYEILYWLASSLYKLSHELHNSHFPHVILGAKRNS